MNKKPTKFKTVWHGILGNSKLSGRDNQALNCLLNFQILSAGLPKLFWCCKSLDLTESEKDGGISVHILFNYQTRYQQGQSACTITVCHPNFCLSNEKICLPGVNSKLVGFYQANGFLFTPEHIGASCLFGN